MSWSTSSTATQGGHVDSWWRSLRSGYPSGGVGGWAAFAVLEPDGPDEPGPSAEQAKWETDAKEACEHAVREARRLDVERRRWEAQADHYAPGWRDQ